MSRFILGCNLPVNHIRGITPASGLFLLLTKLDIGARFASSYSYPRKCHKYISEDKSLPALLDLEIVS